MADATGGNPSGDRASGGGIPGSAAGLAAGTGEPPARGAYRAAGVDVDAGERAVDLMREAVASTRRPEVVGGLGGFAGAIEIPAGYRHPLLVASTDGVGTKTALARAAGLLGGLGMDLVAMCADDVVCAGAEPLFLLDYVAVGRLVPEEIATVVAGVASGCRAAGCALLGGETAEHPGTMAPADLDLAATCVGVVERDELIDGSAVRAGDVLLGLAASGLHSNGFSLVRRLVAEAGLDLDAPYAGILRARAAGVASEPEHADASLGDVLLTPTRIYARAVLAIRAAVRAAGEDLHGIAHVTGGGLPRALPRIVPDGLAARMHPGAWPMPSVMRLLGALGGLDDRELRATFNGGLGMVLALPVGALEAALAAAAAAGIVGVRERRARAVRWLGRHAVPGGGVVSNRIAVGVSGSGSNLRALQARIERQALAARIALVFADRPCPALDWAAEQGLDTALIEDLGAGDPGLRALADGNLAADARGDGGRRGRPCRLHAPGRTDPPGTRSRAASSTSIPRSCPATRGRTRCATRWRPARP